MRLPRTLAELGTPPFEATLVKELRESRDALSLEKACEASGYPEPLSLVIKVGSVTEAEGAVHVQLNITFDETFTGGCGSPVLSRTRFMECNLHIDRETAEAEVEVIARWRGEEF